jgi:hypothetical protein
MTSRACIVSTLAIIALGLPLRASGADTPCVADVQKLCSDVAAGKGRIQACLKQHESQISAACRSKMDALAQEVKELAVVCRFDIGRFCSDVSPGDGRLVTCLTSNASELSPECKDEFDKARK